MQVRTDILWGATIVKTGRVVSLNGEHLKDTRRLRAVASPYARDRHNIPVSVRYVYLPDQYRIVLHMRNGADLSISIDRAAKPHQIEEAIDAAVASRGATG